MCVCGIVRVCVSCVCGIVCVCLSVCVCARGSILWGVTVAFAALAVGVVVLVVAPARSLARTAVVSRFNGSATAVAAAAVSVGLTLDVSRLSENVGDVTHI